MKTIHKSESNPNLKFTKYSNSRVPIDSVNKKQNKLLFSSSQGKVNNNSKNQKSFTTVRIKNI